MHLSNYQCVAKLHGTIDYGVGKNEQPTFMRKLYLIIFLQAFGLYTKAQVPEYFNIFSKEGSFNYTLEQKILSSLSPRMLFQSLDPYYTDTLVQVRQQAYYLSFKISQQAELADQKEAVHILLNGCNDANKAVVGRCLSYLKSFSVKAYDTDSKESLNHLLQEKEMAHFRELYLLAGYVGVGMGTIQQQLLSTVDYNRSQRWVMHLALARMGHKESMKSCILMVEKVEDGNNKVAYLVPDLIYTRQKEAIDFCVDILNSDEKNCLSPNPDIDVKILCGYRVLELLAPVINNFPYKAGSAGNLLVDDYEKALYVAREWFLKHPDYEINTDNF